MFRAAKEGPAKVVTANRLADGIVVFLADEGAWTPAIEDARVLADGPELDAANAEAKAAHDARIVVEPYPIDVEVKEGVPVPVRLRERIRAERGPTIAYGDAERALLGARN